MNTVGDRLVDEQHRGTDATLIIEMDYLGKSLNYFLAAGEVIARLEMDSKQKEITLETNGEEGDIYLEVVEYDVLETGELVEVSFSEPIYEIPKTIDKIETLFQEWFSSK